MQILTDFLSIYILNQISKILNMDRERQLLMDKSHRANLILIIFDKIGCNPVIVLPKENQKVF